VRSSEPLDELVGRLFDYAVTQPEGFTNVEAAKALEISVDRFNRAVHRIRIMLADDDSINLIATREFPQQPWRYQLVGTLAESLWWISNRERDSETRLRTMAAVMKSIVNATDGRTVEGKRARMIYKALSRLVEDLDDLIEAS